MSNKHAWTTHDTPRSILELASDFLDPRCQSLRGLLNLARDAFMTVLLMLAGIVALCAAVS
jgi:hypothetical protein